MPQRFTTVMMHNHCLSGNESRKRIIVWTFKHTSLSQKKLTNTTFYWCHVLCKLDGKITQLRMLFSFWMCNFLVLYFSLPSLIHGCDCTLWGKFLFFPVLKMVRILMHVASVKQQRFYGLIRPIHKCRKAGISWANSLKINRKLWTLPKSEQ